MDSELRTLSSAQTFVMKFIFPHIWIGGFVVATLGLFLFPDSRHTTEGALPHPETRWFLLLARSSWSRRAAPAT
jgi:hypothetical protein